MLTSDLLRDLPRETEWAVGFRLAPLRAAFDDELLRAAFSIPVDHELARLDFVLLTSAGPRYVSARELHPATGAANANAGDGSLHARYAGELRLLPAEADCIGVGELAPYGPVLLHVVIDGRSAHATAVLRAEPDTTNHWLLSAVGVQSVGGQWLGDRYHARFRNDLARHLFAAVLSGFRRSDHCNRFFLQHGQLDDTLSGGLRAAAADTCRWGAHALRLAISALANRARDGGLAMTCLPPFAAPHTMYGDVVPAGLLRFGLAGDAGEHAVAARQRIDDYLDDVRRDGLYSFARGGLATATDSALVLLGRPDTASIAALEPFRRAGGYVPQVWNGAGADPGAVRTMTATPRNAHWCQVDLGTTCIVRHLQRTAGLPAATPIELLENEFERRASLFFAVPYLTDWAYALAIGADPNAGALRSRLAAEVAASAAHDGAFGRYDRGLSTALAVLTLDALGYGGDVVRRAQLRLLDLLDGEMMVRGEIPFFSSLSLDRPAEDGMALPDQVVRVGSALHAITYYRDDPGAICCAFVARALAVEPRAGMQLATPPEMQSHPRYLCDRDEYVAGHVLPRYALG